MMMSTTKSLFGAAVLAMALLVPSFAHAQKNADSGSESPSYAQAVRTSDLSQSQQATLLEANDLLASNQGKAAFELLRPLENQLAGDYLFDLLYGRAALSADEPSLAAFSFERCLVTDPFVEICRLGMARAHIALNEEQSARTELDSLRHSTQPQVRESLAQYSELLDGIKYDNSDTRLSSYLQFGIGFDSNINAVTSQDSMSVPSMGGAQIRLRPDSRSKESGFASARYNIRYSTPIATGWRFLAEANIAGVGNFVTSSHNTLVSDLSLGVSRRADKHLFTLRAQGQNYRLGGSSYRNSLGVLGQYAYSIDETMQVGAFVQVSRLNYSSSSDYPNNGLRNANRYVGGITWQQGLANDRAVMFASVYGGAQETVDRTAHRHYDFSIAGGRIGGMYLMTPRLQMQASLGAEQRFYGGQDPMFLKTRNDTFYDFSLGAVYAINRKLSLRPQYTYYKSSSNVNLYNYDRHVFSINLRYELF